MPTRNCPSNSWPVTPQASIDLRYRPCVSDVSSNVEWSGFFEWINVLGKLFESLNTTSVQTLTRFESKNERSMFHPCLVSNQPRANPLHERGETHYGSP